MTGKAPDIEHVSQESQDGTWLILKTPDYDTVVGGNQLSYLRLGSADAQQEKKLLTTREDVKAFKALLDDQGEPRAGWFEYTDGDRTIVTIGEKREFVGGTYDLRVVGAPQAQEQAPTYTSEVDQERKTEWGDIAKSEYFTGYKESFFAGYNIDATAGIGLSLSLGGKFAASVGIDTNFFAGAKFEIGLLSNFTMTKATDWRIARDFDQVARESIRLCIQPTSGPDYSSKLNLGLLAAIGLTSAGALAALADGKEGKTSKNAMGVTIPAYLGLIAAAIGIALQQKKNNKRARTTLDMNENSLKIENKKIDGTTSAKLFLGEPNGSINLVNDGASLMMTQQGQVVLLSRKDMEIIGKGTNVILKDGKMAINGQNVVVNGGNVTIGNVLTVRGEDTPPAQAPNPTWFERLYNFLHW